MRFIRLSDNVCLPEEPKYPRALHRRGRVYLPKCEWKGTDGSIITSGGEYITADAPLDVMPVFERMG